MAARRTLRNGTVALLAAGVTLAASGCSGTGAAAEGGGGAGGAADAREVVRRAPDVLAGSGTSHAFTALRMASGGTRITIEGEGRFDYGERTGELRLTLPEGERVTEVFVPGLLYIKNRGAGVPADKWVRIDTGAVRDGNLVTGGATDPITAAELLRGVTYAADLGWAEVDGERLRHYRGVTDIATAAERATGGAREQLATAVGGFTRTQVPFDVYLDARGLLRKVRHQFSFAGGGGGGGGTGPGGGVEVASTVTLRDFGAPVDVVLPASDDVFAGAVV
ncbi:hypothetical protein [Streptomyces avicenniae]|uniref:hypothetical protein n=1 Tax=Streptomyces avicenniae TaxID=500153 RepID=UPI00069AA767|nr:hypothetical protein [Streptomyces avicenniae]